MLMHLSLGIAAKVGGLENCRSRVDLQPLKSHSRAVYADMQIAQSCKSCSRANHAAAARNRGTRAAVYSKGPRGSHSPPAHLRPPAHSHAAGTVENAASAESESKAVVIAGRA